MSTGLENLNLEEGKSAALRAALVCIAESSAADGGPRYSGKVCRELARAIVCRNYARPILELVHLMVAASAAGGHFEDVFWGVDRATADEFHTRFEKMAGAADHVRILPRGVVHGEGDAAFQISYRRMPFLASLLEFMIVALGYGDVDDLTRPLRHRAPVPGDVLAVTKALQQRLYGYLKDHLPPAQRQRRERHFLTFVGEYAGNRSGADAITDAMVLSYWQKFAEDERIEARTYRGVFETSRRLIVALDAATERLAATRAAPIGTGYDSGEVDPADVDAVVAHLEDGESPLARVLAACGDTVKFVNVNEAEMLQDLPLGDGSGRRIPISVLRNAIWGAVQIRISAALRRGNSGIERLLPEPAQELYRLRIAACSDLAASLERLALAALWPLHQAGDSAAIEVALALAPDLDWAGLATTGDDRGVESLDMLAAARRFFATVPDPQGDELPALLSDARQAWRGVNRIGFKDVQSSNTNAALAEAAPEVLRLIAAIRRFLDNDLRGIDWPTVETEDVVTFGQMLRRLYGLRAEAPDHAC